jgi:hypothetical protein
LARGGSHVEWRAAPRIDDGGSQWYGASHSRQRTRAKLRAQGGSAGWRHGGVIGGIDKVYADLTHEDCSEVRWR